MCIQKIRSLLVFAFLFIVSHPLYAASVDGMPWDTPAQQVQNWLSGSIARIVAIVLIAVSGIMFAHGEHGSAFRRMMGIVFGIAIATGAATIYSALAFGGAVV